MIRHPSNAVERLCYTGKQGMGALEFRPAIGPGYDKNEQIKVNELVQLASDILNRRTDIHVTADDTAMRQILQPAEPETQLVLQVGKAVQ